MAHSSIMDLQRQRLKHLMANAILELWKKETGSLSSVVIEGTICITSGSGKTTVVQVNDKFCGSIPEAENSFDSSRNTPNNSFSTMTSRRTPNNSFGHLDYHNQAAVAAYYDHLSPASILSPNTEFTRANSRSRSPSVTPKEKSVQLSKEKENPAIKEEVMSDVEDEEVNNNNKQSTGGVIAGTGYYTCGSPDLNQNDSTPNLNFSNESGIADMSGKSDSPDQDRPSSTPSNISGDKIGAPSVTSTPLSSRDIDALDLTRLKDNDLAISSPQSYTAQVRNVIRQRLLAAKANSTTNLTANEGERETPNMLRSLGLHRAEKENSDVEMKENENAAPLNLSGSTGFSFPARDTANVNGPLHDMLRRKPQVQPPPLIRSPFVNFPTGLPTMVESQSALSQMSSTIMNLGLGGMRRSQEEEPSSGKASPSSVNGEQKVYKCNYCTKTFLFKSKYHEHLPVHTNARPFQCHLCSRTYKYKYDLRVHLRTHMGIPTKSTVCPFCNVKHESNKRLRQHIKEAHRDKQKITEDDCTQHLEQLSPAL